MTSAEIRRQFIEYFVQQHGHTFVPSSPVVPHDDPTLLFTNAGMNQYKPYFLGTAKAPYPRAANTQKCIRAGGKHNDLDDVGRSRRHHTFFEMLGNWSFGDYFKQGAIEMAWELLTKVWKLDPTRLHVSCYEGDEKHGIPRDTEAADIWRKVANWEQYGQKSDEHIHYFGKDNFWEMGDTGPCGPCTEIYIDRTPDKNGGPEVNGTDPRVMEIWNLVFIQYNRDASGHLTPLPSQHVDTGMGLERICQVIQGKDDNYGTDLFTPLFEALTKLTGFKYEGKFPKTNAADPVAEAADAQLRHDIAFRVIADHIRCLTFALTDGAVPSNEGRGYVLRRILRRAVRFGRQQLGLREPFLHTLVAVVVETMGEMFPELKKNPGRVIEIIKEEEESFGRTLDRGIELFEDAAANAGSGKIISANDAFRLYDTYGFPIDLTRIMAEERAMQVDLAGYEKLMEEARERSRAVDKNVSAAVLNLPPDVIAKLADQKIVATEDHAKFQLAPIQAKVRAIWTGTQLEQSISADGQQVALILDHTNFYAEMGGQVGDTGEIQSHGGAIFTVTATHAVAGYVLHIGQLQSGKISVLEKALVTVKGGRERTMKNHTSTHLANWALREVLGEDVHQKGSLVDPEKLRFDFVHSKAVSDDELSRVEKLVTEYIARKAPVYAVEAPQEQALKIAGLRAVFGEKYPPKVRVVSVGAPVEELLADPANPKWRNYAIEFCGGTHLGNSADAEAFVVSSEESVSKGIRRIVALTGPAAKAALASGKQVDDLIAQLKKTAEAELPAAIAGLQKAIAGQAGEGVPLLARRRAQAAIGEAQAKYKAYQKSAASAGKSEGTAGGGGGGGLNGFDPEALLGNAQKLGSGITLITAEIPQASADVLRNTWDWLKKKHADGQIVALLASSFVDQDKDGNALPPKANLLAAVGDPLVGKLKAGDWIKAVAPIVGGSGGGRPQLAMAGGKDPQKIAEALTQGAEFAKTKLA